MKKSEKCLKDKYKVVEYKPHYADAVAEMWKQSRDGWNGQVLYDSGEAVQRAEASSSHLKLWLALEAEKVVGYCKLSKFNKEHALYLDYLNVRDDYHGEKIGKMFVLKCVEETIERGFPRLDLYTWGGNLAAIPLYKKCGFVWQKAERSTHCLNFIPSVVSNPLLQKYMQNIDWYDDNARKIEIVPDDIVEKKFIYFRYLWQKDGEQVEAEFCRFGRGLRRIKTKDFEITVDIADRDLVFDQTYSIRYRVKNFSSQPLDLQIAGQSNQNVKFDFEKSYQVKDSQEIAAEFFVKPVEAEYEKTDILPNVVSALVVNGVKVDFEIGFFPQFPLLLKLKTEKKIMQKNRPQTVFLEVENRLKDSAKATFRLPQLPELDFLQPLIELDLAAEEKRSLALQYRMQKACYYDQKILVEMQKTVDSKLTFPVRLQKLFPSYDDFAWGESEKFFEASIGSNYLRIFKTGSNKNLIGLRNLQSDTNLWLGNPALGNPPSAEFEERFASKVKIYREAERMVADILYRSEDFPGIEIERLVSFSLSGFAQQSWKVINRGEQDYQQLQLRDIFGTENYRVIPYAGKFIELSNEFELDLQFVKTKDVEENWIYCKKENQTCGLSWDDSLDLHAHDWYNQLIYNQKFDLPKQAEQVVPSISAAFDRFSNWQDFRNFVLDINEKPCLTSYLELKINDDYPIVQDRVEVQAISQNNQKPIGQIKLAESACAKIIQNKKNRIELDICQSGALGFRYNYQQVELGVKRLFIKEQPGEIEQKIVKDSGKRIYTLDNGIISFSASAEFAPAIFSLRYKGREWLDNSFPQPGPKSWDNPWTGGLAILPNHLRMVAFLSESSKVDFCTKFDNKGRKWQGIEISTKFLRSEKLEGLNFSQFFLTIEEQPILLVAYQMENLSGKLKTVQMNARIYPTSHEKLQQNVIQSGNLKFYPGHESNYAQIPEILSYYARNSQDKLHLFPLATQLQYYGYTMLNDQFYFGGFVHQNLHIADQSKNFELISLIYFDQNEHQREEVRDFSKLIFRDDQ